MSRLKRTLPTTVQAASSTLELGFCDVNSDPSHNLSASAGSARYCLERSLINALIDLRSRSVNADGRSLELSRREYELLEILALRKGRIVSRDQIGLALYDLDDEPNSNVIDVYIGYLRRKLESIENAPLIQTRRGLGYVLLDPES